jgi:hypothetical protein
MISVSVALQCISFRSLSSEAYRNDETIDIDGIQMGYMYILICSDGSYYTGSTKYLKLRINQHRSGEGANYTKKRYGILQGETITRRKNHFLELNPR